MRKSKTQHLPIRSTHELAKAIGINSETEIALMEYKARLSVLATKAIIQSNMSVNDLVRVSGVARSKVSAIKNGALSGISSDLFLKVIAATGNKIKFNLAA